MPRCPNCSYILVLLEKRAKYKCSRCSRLYKQKLIEDKEFRELNKQQRDIDKRLHKKLGHIEWLKNNQEWGVKYRKQYYLKHREKILNYVKEYNLKNKEKIQDYRNKNKEKIRIAVKKHYYKNREQILANKKIYRQLSKQQDYEWRRSYRNKNRERTRLLTRISFWRQQQKKLALEMLEKQLSEGYGIDI